MDKNITGRRQLFSYPHFVLLAFAFTWSKARECGQCNSPKICCSGYREINGTCTECIGYIGKDFLVQLVPMERDVSSLVNVLCTRLVISLLGIWQTQRLNITGRRQLFAYTHFVLLAFAITWSKAKECGQSTSSKICCSGYREINGTCTECIGYIGKDCNVPCPTGFYGERCFESCKCSVYETCNQFVGCISNSTFESKYRKSVHNESCSSLFPLVIALTASQIVTLICCLKTLRWKGCSLSAKQTERSTGLSTGMTPSQTNIGMSEARIESSRHLGISCEEEITNGLHCHTDRYQDNLKCPSNKYDTFETVDRIKKA